VLLTLLTLLMLLMLLMLLTLLTMVRASSHAALHCSCPAAG
jgi:hypothetical protein